MYYIYTGPSLPPMWHTDAGRTGRRLADGRRTDSGRADGRTADSGRSIKMFC